MIENKAKIKSGAPKRNSVCYQTLQDIVIPAGTILRDASVYRGSTPEMCCNVGLDGITGYFSVDAEFQTEQSGFFKKVIA